MEKTLKFIDIPEIFLNSDKENFSNCLVCNKYLLEENTIYFIEKAIRNYPEQNIKDTVFEYAMCIDCMDYTQNELSEESLERIEKYFDEHLNIHQRQRKLLETENIDDFIENCAITNEHISDLNEYVVESVCIGNKIVLSFYPMMLSGKVYDEIADLLSQKTIDFLNKFRDDHFGYPPELNDIFNKRFVLL